MWFVKAEEPSDPEVLLSEESAGRIEIWGPFESETDAKAYAIDLWMDNGWEEAEAVQYDSFEEALQQATDKIVHYPYAA